MKEQYEKNLVERTRNFLNSIYVSDKEMPKVKKALLELFDVSLHNYNINYEIDKFTVLISSNKTNVDHCISIDFGSASTTPKRILA
jgi:hypothetical protein